MNRTANTSAPPSVVRCAIYTRKSTSEGLEREFNSIEAQREAAEAYAGNRRHEGWAVLIDRYDDGGFTGANTERPALTRLLHDVEQGLVDAILVYKVDRLSRSLLDFAKMVDVLERRGVSFVSVTQNFDTSTPLGRLTLNILLSFAQFEREMIIDRVRDAIAGAKRRGKFTGGTPPLGYDVDREAHRLVVNQDEAEVVRQIFKSFAETGSGLGIAKELNNGGIATKSWVTKKGKHRPGKPYNASHIYRILNNHVYLGETVHRENVYPGEHEAIVPKRLWDKAHAILQVNGRKEQRAHENAPALLRGIIRCGHCDRAMTSTYTVSNGRAYRYYVCTQAKKGGYDSCPVRSVPAGDIEEAVMGQVRVVLRSPETIAQTYMAAKRLASEEHVDDSITTWEVTDALTNLDSIWDQLFPLERRRIVHTLVEGVVVYRDSLDVKIRADGLHSIVGELTDNPGGDSERLCEV